MEFAGLSRENERLILSPFQAVVDWDLLREYTRAWLFHAQALGL